MYTLVVDITLPDMTIIVLNDANADNAVVDIDEETRFIAVFSDAVSYVYDSYVQDISFAGCASLTDSLNADTYTGGMMHPQGTVQVPTTNGYCFMAEDAAGNFYKKHTDRAIVGVSNFMILGSTKESGTDTYHTRSGTRGITGISAAGSKVLLKLADAADDPSEYTDAERQSISFSTVNFNVPADESSFEASLPISSSDNGKQLVGWIWPDYTDSSTATPALRLGMFAVDDQAPSFTGPTEIVSDNATDSFATTGNILEVNFMIDEVLAEDPEVIVSGELAVKDAVKSSGQEYVYTAVLTAAVEEGFAHALVIAKDRAGNENTLEVSSSVVIDTRSPEVVYRREPAQNFLSPTSPPESVLITVSLTDPSGIAGQRYDFSIAAGSQSANCSIAVPAGVSTVVTDTCTFALSSSYIETDQVTVTTPAIMDVVGNVLSSSQEILYRFDGAAPSVDSIADPDVSSRGQATFSMVASHNQAAFDQGVLEQLVPVFANTCSGFKTDDVLSSDGTQDPVTYAFMVDSISGIFSDCTLALRDEAGVMGDQAPIPSFTVRSSSSGGSSGGGGGRLVMPDLEDDEGSAGGQPIDLIDSIIVFFARDLTIGSIGEDVRALQVYLNQNNYILTPVGPGSPGNETDYFGELTRQALIRYQEANGIIPADGYFGALTRAVLVSVVIPGDSGLNFPELEPDTPIFFAPPEAGVGGTPDTPAESVVTPDTLADLLNGDFDSSEGLLEDLLAQRELLIQLILARIAELSAEVDRLLEQQDTL